MTVTAAQLAQRTRRSGVHIDQTMAAMFLGYWLASGVVVELRPGRYALTPKGARIAAGLLSAELEGARRC